MVVVVVMMFYPVIDSTKSLVLFKLFDMAQIETIKSKKLWRDRKRESEKTFTKWL